MHGTVDAGQQADGTQPLLPYLEEQRARRLLFQGRHDEAKDAFERAVAVAGPVSPDAFAAYAIEIARIAVRAAEEGSPDAKSLLGDSATRWLDPAAKGVSETQLAATLAYWQGRVALAQAGAAGDEEAEAGRKAACRAKDRLSAATASADSDAAKAAESWLPEARRLHALHVLRLGDAQPLMDELQQHRDYSTVTLATGEHFTLSWSGLASFFKEIDTSFGRELVQLAAATLRRDAIMPAAPPQRLVIELSESALGTDLDAKRLIGREVEAEELDDEGLAPDDRSSPSIWALRRLLSSRFGVSLPAVLVRPVSVSLPDYLVRPVQSDEPSKRVRVLLDNVPVYDAVWAGEAEHFVRGGSDVSWPFASYRPLLPTEAGIETEPIDTVQYAAWHLGQAVLRSLPQLAGSEQASHLRLGHLPLAVTHPMLQLLLWDRTPLLERAALRDLASRAADNRLSATAAAEAFRRVPAVRSSLWGVEGSWEDRVLDAAQEVELKQLLTGGAAAGTVHGKLFEAIDRLASRRTPPAGKPEQPAPPRLVVRDPALRPWLRALLWQHPNVPVVAASEIGLRP